MRPLQMFCAESNYRGPAALSIVRQHLTVRIGPVSRRALMPKARLGD